MKKYEHIQPIAVDIYGGLLLIPGISKNTFIKLAKDADAVIHLGIRRTLYNVQKIQHFLNSRTGEEFAYFDDSVNKCPESAVAAIRKSDFEG